MKEEKWKELRDSILFLIVVISPLQTSKKINFYKRSQNVLKVTTLRESTDIFVLFPIFQ